MADAAAKSGIERHLQTIIAGLVLVTVIWVGSTTSDNAKELAVMNVRFQGMEVQLAALAENGKSVSTRYADLDRKVSDMANRVERLVGRVKAHQDNDKVHNVRQ
jgi:hypothetical protein